MVNLHLSVVVPITCTSGFLSLKCISSLLSSKAFDLFTSFVMNSAHILQVQAMAEMVIMSKCISMSNKMLWKLPRDINNDIIFTIVHSRWFFLLMKLEHNIEKILHAILDLGLFLYFTHTAECVIQILKEGFKKI